MGLSLNANDARKADNVSSQIRESGKYVGVITRAEKLKSRNDTEGLGLSFKSDDGATANYLDIYTKKADGELLRGHNLVQAILCCLRLKDVADGTISVEKWDKERGEVVKVTVPGYPAMMGKRVGFILQKELGTHYEKGTDTERMNIYAVFEASTNLVASEILDGKTVPERIKHMVRAIELAPVWDTRKRTKPAPAAVPMADAVQNNDFDDDIPFAWVALIPLGGLLAYAVHTMQTVLQV